MRILVLVAALWLSIVVAHAETTPWAEGVSKGHQERALALFKDGNAFFEDGKYMEALGEYEKALKLWDHPNIQFNLAICLVHIRQPLDAWDHLDKALRFGEAPLGKRLYLEALNYKTILETALAQLEVSSEDEEAEVQIDGKVLFTGPAHKKIHLLAGSHQLVATRDGYQTLTKALDLPAGKVTKEDIELEPEKVRVKVKKVRENYDRRWSWWIPWATAAAGITVALVGTGIYLDARSSMNNYDDALAKKCPAGCMAGQIPVELAAQRDSAHNEGNVGVGFWVAGGAVAVTAGVMAILNRPKVSSERRPAMSVIVKPGFVGAGLATAW